MRTPITSGEAKALIGSTIVFVYMYKDYNLMGKIVDLDGDDKPVVYLPESSKHKDGSLPTYRSKLFTWYCRWKDIELVDTTGAQLEFNF